MKITRQTVAEKIGDHLHGELSQNEIVDWAERTMMDADFGEKDAELFADIVGRLGLADVAAVTQPKGEAGLSIRASLGRFGRFPSSSRVSSNRYGSESKLDMFSTLAFPLPTFLVSFPGVFYRNDRPAASARL